MCRTSSSCALRASFSLLTTSAFSDLSISLTRRAYKKCVNDLYMTYCYRTSIFILKHSLTMCSCPYVPPRVAKQSGTCTLYLIRSSPRRPHHCYISSPALSTGRVLYHLSVPTSPVSLQLSISRQLHSASLLSLSHILTWSLPLPSLLASLAACCLLASSMRRSRGGGVGRPLRAAKARASSNLS